MKGITMAQLINLFQNNGFILWRSVSLFVRKIGPVRVHVAEPGFMEGGRQVAVRRNISEFGIF